MGWKGWIGTCSVSSDSRTRGFPLKPVRTRLKSNKRRWFTMQQPEDVLNFLIFKWRYRWSRSDGTQCLRSNLGTPAPNMPDTCVMAMCLGNPLPASENKQTAFCYWMLLLSTFTYFTPSAIQTIQQSLSLCFLFANISSTIITTGRFLAKSQRHSLPSFIKEKGILIQKKNPTTFSSEFITNRLQAGEKLLSTSGLAILFRWFKNQVLHIMG